MSARVSIRAILGALLLIGCGLAAGCGGDTAAGKAEEQNGEGTQFDPSNVGTISLDVNDDPLQVAEVTGFTVHVRDANGVGVPLTRVSCDSEAGVAIIEPTTGAEITDAAGRISGKIGCESPGSYLFGCRLPVGVNKRTFVTVHCAPPVPEGFSGFPGASGGGLGTGGTAQEGDIRVTSITFDDGFGVSTAIDTVRDTDCNLDGATTTTDIEGFFDTKIAISVTNGSNQSITFNSYSYKVAGVFQSDDIALAGGTIAPNGSTDFASLFTKASTSGTKFFITASTPIGTLGIKNVQITLHGTTDGGDDVSVTSTTVVGLDNYDHCS